MTYKQYAAMIRFLHQNCSDGVLEPLAGAGATHSGEEIKSKDAFLWTLALHLHRLQRYTGTVVGLNPSLACSVRSSLTALKRGTSVVSHILLTVTESLTQRWSRMRLPWFIVGLLCTNRSSSR